MPSNEYMREYMANRRVKRRDILIDMLGGCCASCKTIEDLDFDHIDPATKLFNISGRGLDKAWKIILAEVAKCQLLCHPCHKIKSADELAVGHGEGLSGKKNCPCDLCRAQKARYMKAYGHPNR